MLRLQQPLPESYTKALPEVLADRIGAARSALGNRLVVLGHHYQRDDVMRWADARGDSFGLSRIAASRPEARYVVFCGVHFMAEAADILTGDHQAVLLPDLNAGCSMADMADAEEVDDCWEELSQVTDAAAVVPVTYMNSSAALKAFVGRRGGAVCTSSNARPILEWALRRGEKVLFFPDQHLGRNTGYQMGFGPQDMVVWDPRRPLGGLSEAEVKRATLVLWKGHCSVHQRFRPEHIADFRARHPGGRVIAHPECAHEVVSLADSVGSTDFIIREVDAAPPGATLGIATEIHLVSRLAHEHPRLRVVSLDPMVCPCSTMSRIDPPHLAWVLEGLLDGEVRNRIAVGEPTAADARVALERMLSIT